MFRLNPFDSAIKITMQFAFPAWAKKAPSPWAEGWGEGIASTQGTEPGCLALL